jgi:hypothetical protein
MHRLRDVELCSSPGNSDKLLHTSKIYDGMKSEYWVYVPAGYDPQVPAALGTPAYRFVQAYSTRWHRTLKDSMRSTEYGTVSDRYVRFLRDETTESGSHTDSKAHCFCLRNVPVL